jgi:predicted nucleic acid-binding protein
MNGAADPLFIDTNVLVYARLNTSPYHRQARVRLSQLRKAGVAMSISRQVIREYLTVVTRSQSFSTPLTSAEAVEDARQLEQLFEIADETAAVTEGLLTILDSITVGGKQIHDANIVATMQVNGISRLLTHNTGDFKRFGDLITVESLLDMPGQQASVDLK